jgi:hypothetical protein
VEGLGNLFQNYSRQTSSNYGIGYDGKVGMYVEEEDRSWCSSSNSNDQRAVTIECASQDVAPYAFNTVVYNKLVELCADICRRNGKNKLLWLGTKERTLNYVPRSDEMVLTVHRWFANKSCPGEWMFNRMGELARDVNAKLTVKSEVLYRVQIGAFTKVTNAQNYAQKAQKAGYPAIIVTVKHDGHDLFRVQCGAFESRENAEQFCSQLHQDGFPAIITEVVV